MRQWNKETIEEQLKLHKKQNKDERYNYFASEFNSLWYCWELEKYTINKQQQIDQLTNNWNKLEEYIKERIQYWEEQEKEWIKQGFMKFGGEANNKIILQGLLDKMKEIKEGNE